MKKLVWKLARWLHHLDFAYVLPAIARLPRGIAFTLARWRGEVNGMVGRDWRSMGLGFRHIYHQSRTGYAMLPLDATPAQLDLWRKQRFIAEARDEFEARWIAAGRFDELNCEFTPPHALDVCRNRTRGLVLLTPHFESYFAGVAFLARSGTTVNLMTSAVTHDPRVDDAVKDHFEKKYNRVDRYLNGGKVVNMETGLRPFYSMLQRNETLVVLGDSPVLPNGASMNVDFLGATRKIAGGALRLAKYTHSDIGGFVCVPTAQGEYQLVLCPPGPADDPETMKRIYSFLSEHILSNPGGWWSSDLFPFMPEAVEPGDQ